MRSGFTDGLARGPAGDERYGPSGVNVNALLPGATHAASSVDRGWAPL